MLWAEDSAEPPYWALRLCTASSTPSGVGGRSMSRRGEFFGNREMSTSRRLALLAEVPGPLPNTSSSRLDPARSVNSFVSGSCEGSARFFILTKIPGYTAPSATMLRDATRIAITIARERGDRLDRPGPPDRRRPKSREITTSATAREISTCFASAAMSTVMTIMPAINPAAREAFPPRMAATTIRRLSANRLPIW